MKNSTKNSITSPDTIIGINDIDINNDDNTIVRASNKILSYEEFTERTKNLRTLSDVTSFLKNLIAPTIQTMLEAEMDLHLGYPKKHPAGNLSGNSRNGHSEKTVKTEVGGSVRIQIPRDRNGDFTPVAIKKYESIESSIEERIVSMYAKGMTTRDINAHMKDIYGVDVSADMVSAITDKVMPLVKEWQSRPLCPLYTIVYLDAVHFKVREGGRIISKAAYIMLGVNMLGMKEILGIWIGENEGAKYWLGLLNEIKNRGVEDILICCIDGLTGFSEAIKSVFAKTEIQRCVVHQIRNTLRYVSWRDRRNFCQDLKAIYQAPTEAAGYEALQKMKETWSQYRLSLESWEKNWSELSTFFVYPEEVRKIIYTTNSIEGLNRQLRKVTKTTSIFPHDDSLAKLLWLAQNDITKKWNMPIQNWGQIVHQFAIMFPERISLESPKF